MARNSFEIEDTLRRIFRRCVICPPGVPSCPPCAPDETCSLKAPSCNECASTVCVQTASLPGQSTPQKSTPIGAIAGGAVAGVLIICIITYFLYRFWYKRRARAEQAWVDQKVESRDQSGLARADRQSTRSAHSIASTVLTRASNVIQIAYIPGVTNRTPPDSPTNFAPPVPALPFSSVNTSAASSPHLEQDMHFFMPSDLRDSAYSNLTEEQRMSIAPSLARASLATTLYRGDAIISPMAAQQAFLTRPAVVSVKSGSTTGANGTPTTTAPPVPRIPANMGGSSIVGRTLTPRPIEVRKASSGSMIPTLGNLARAASSGKTSSDGAKKSPLSSQYSDEKEVIVQSPGTHEGPLRETNAQDSDTAGINAMIEDAMRSAARDATHMGLGRRPELRKQDSGPFSDANEIGKENFG